MGIFVILDSRAGFFPRLPCSVFSRDDRIEMLLGLHWSLSRHGERWLARTSVNHHYDAHHFPAPGKRLVVCVLRSA